MRVDDRTLVITGILAFVAVLGSIITVLSVTGGVGGIVGLSIINETHGTVNVTVSTTVSMALLNSNVNFGTGYINAAGSTLINTTEPNDNPNGFSSPTSFWLRNDGNVYVNLSVNSTQDANDLFSTAIPSYQYRLENTSHNEWTNSSCFDYVGGGAAEDKMAYALIAQDLQTYEKIVCPNMSYANSSAFTDEINVSILLTLNSTVNGTGNDHIQFTAISLGS